MERDEIEELKRYYEAMNFNSRAHVERDLIQIRKLYFLTKISTHALMWSATGKNLWGLMRWLNFNSRAHVERDAHG